MWLLKDFKIQIALKTLRKVTLLILGNFTITVSKRKYMEERVNTVCQADHIFAIQPIPYKKMQQQEKFLLITSIFPCKPIFYSLVFTNKTIILVVHPQFTTMFSKSSTRKSFYEVMRLDQR